MTVQDKLEATTISNRFYIIRNIDIHAGFCALVLYALNGLRKANELGAIPVVHFTKENVFDFYDASYGEDIWQYFFEPLSNYTFKQVMDALDKGLISSEQVYTPSHDEVMHAHLQEEQRIATIWGRKVPSDKSRWMDEKRAMGRKFVKEYIKVKPVIEEEITAFFNGHLKNYFAIGVHIRGTDFAYAEPVSLDRYFEQVNSLISSQKTGSCKVFVASDQVQYVEAFKDKYGPMMVSIPAIRSDSHIVPYRLDGISGFKKGKDVLIDMLLLSKCNHVIKCAAATGEMALWFSSEPSITDFSLQSEFYNIGYGQMETAFAKLNIGGLGRLSLKIHKISANVMRRIRYSKLGWIMYSRFKIVRKWLKH